MYMHACVCSQILFEASGNICVGPRGFLMGGAPKERVGASEEDENLDGVSRGNDGWMATMALMTWRSKGNVLIAAERLAVISSEIIK